MKLRFVLILIILASGVPLMAQTKQKHNLTFYPVFGNSPLRSNESFYKLSNGDSLQIETLKFYISEIELFHKGKMVWKEKNSFHLIDAYSNESMHLSFQTTSPLQYDQVKFNLGIDSITNTSGAMGGDLDPTRGMYWTWQNGYINFKLEGRNNKCKTKNNEFQFHLGGYQHPFNTLQTLMIEAKEGDKIIFDIKKLISLIEFEKQNHIMSPSKEAVLLSEKITQIFGAQP